MRRLLTRNFRVTVIHGDNELNIDSIKDSCLPSNLHICSKNEHVPVIERSIRTVKERAWCTSHSIPYVCNPKLVKIALMEHIEYWLNTFPSTDSILDTVGPANLVEGKPNIDCNKSFVPFGAYTLVYIGTNNTLDARTVAAIALNAANEFGGYYFISLETGKRIHSKQWDVLPISNNVIDTVNDLGNEQQQPTLKHRVPLFEWAPGIEIDVPNDDDDEELSNKIADNQPILDIQEFNDATEQNMVTDNEEDDNSISSNIS